MNLQITVQRECVCCGQFVTTVLQYDGSQDAKRFVSSDCECGCSLELRVVHVTDKV